MAFKLTLVTPTSNKTLGIRWLELETTHGNLVIQEGHAPLITSLKELCDVRFETDGGLVEGIEVRGGIAKIDRKSALIIIDQ